MKTAIVRRVLSLFFLVQVIIAFPTWAVECPLSQAVNYTLSLGDIVIDSNLSNSSTPVLLATRDLGKAGWIDCHAGNDGSDWYGWTNNTASIQSESWSTTNDGVTYSYQRVFWPTTIPGIYYTIYAYPSSEVQQEHAYMPSVISATGALHVDVKNSVSFNMNIVVEIWQRGVVTAVGDAKPTQSGLLGTFRAGNSDSQNPLLQINVGSSAFTVKFKTPTCSLSVSPTTIDFGDVNNQNQRKSFTLQNSGCVNASGVTLKLTSTQAAVDNNGLGILANTTTGTSAAGGRGVAVSYEDGSSRKYLSANDVNSSVTIDFGSIVTAKDIPMAGLFTCTSASNSGTCDNYTPGAFTASGTISATYK